MHAMKVEIMSEAALKFQYSKLTFNRADVYDKIQEHQS